MLPGTLLCTLGGCVSAWRMLGARPWGAGHAYAQLPSTLLSGFAQRLVLVYTPNTW